jgi:hypothetical protein
MKENLLLDPISGSPQASFQHFILLAYNRRFVSPGCVFG